MKKILIGTLVGGILFFAFQSVMWTGGFNDDFHTYTSDQPEILSVLDSKLMQDGLYVMPMPDPAQNLSHEETEKMMSEQVGQPQAMIFFQKHMKGMDPMSIVKGLLMALAGCLIASMVIVNGSFISATSRFAVAFSFGIFTLLQGTFDDMNWWGFPWSFIKPQVLDMTIGWGIASVWLAWYLKPATK